MCPFKEESLPTGADPRSRFNDFIDDPKFPCVGAKSALNKDRLRYGHYAVLGDAGSAAQLRNALLAFSEEYPDAGTQPVSFIATFDSDVGDELDFENRLWLQLRLMNEMDQGEVEWDPSVSADPASEQFSMSIAGRAFFVVGLHPAASRLSRRSPMPCLVFNFHSQFETLKASGKYASMQKAIRARDAALQGSINPVLARFGEASEARQYSGRAVPSDWVCPFSNGGSRNV